MGLEFRGDVTDASAVEAPVDERDWSAVRREECELEIAEDAVADQKLKVLDSRDASALEVQRRITSKIAE